MMTYTLSGNITWETAAGYRSLRERGPSFISISGTIYFSQLSASTLGRIKGPATIDANGKISYRNGGHLHRTTGPAVITAGGCKTYWVHNTMMPATEFFLKYGVI